MKPLIRPPLLTTKKTAAASAAEHMNMIQVGEMPLLGCGIYTQVAGDEVVRGKEARRWKKRWDGDGGSRGGGKKRRLSGEQVKFLEMNFGRERKLGSGRKVHLATELGMDPKQVAVWFQNRRVRWKAKQLEEEYGRLKSMHDAVVVEKCLLQNEVMKLKQQLSEANSEISKLTPLPKSSFSMEAQWHTAGQISSESSVRAGGVAEPPYSHDYYSCDDYFVNRMMDWVNLYGI